MSDSNAPDRAQSENTSAHRVVALRDNHIDSQALLGGGRSVIIQHGEKEYTLSLTKLGKLILTS